MDFYCCWSRHQYPAVVLSVWVRLDTIGSPQAENCSRYKPAWSQLDTVRNYSEGGISSYFTHFTDLLKTNQSPLNSFSYSPSCFFFFFNFHYLILKLYQVKFWKTAAAPFQSHVWMVWWSEGSQHWDHGIPMLSLCFVPRLPSVPQTTTPPSADGRPTRGQAASVCANSSVSCPVLCCTYVCVCVCVSARRPLHAYLRLLRNIQEITGKTELNIM